MVRPISRRRFFSLGAATCLPLALPRRACSDNPEDAERNPAKDMITPEAQKAIDRGLEYLAHSQHPDGGWGERPQYSGNIAVTSLAGLAFMAGGHQPGRGPYGKKVEMALDYLLKNQQDSPPGYLYVGRGNSFGAMYSHGFGTLFLAEAYGMVSSKKKQAEIRRALERAVELILKAQNKVLGGWRYDTDGTASDVSVTICQIMALRSARNAGFKVPKSVVDKCTEYVKKCQNDDGGFNYMLTNRNSSLFPRSAAGLCALYCAGIYEGREVERALNYLMQFKPTGRTPNAFGGRNLGELHYYYGHYYAAQAMWTAGGRYWQEWFPAIRDELLARARQGNGVWTDNAVCTDYGTAMACIILQIPNNYLPIMQK